MHGHLSRGLLNPQKPKTHILPNPQESKTPCQSLICPQLPLNLHERQSNWTQDREIEINWKKKEKEIEKSRGRGGPQAELMGVWVYKGVLDFRLRLKIKRRIGIFWDTSFFLEYLWIFRESIWVLLFSCQESERKGNDINFLCVWFLRKGKKGQENEWILKLRN